MPTGYEVQMYQDISVIAKSLYRVSRIYEYKMLRDLLAQRHDPKLSQAAERLGKQLWPEAK